VADSLAARSGQYSDMALTNPSFGKKWIYDLRTDQHFTLKQRPLTRADLDEFVACFNPENRSHCLDVDCSETASHPLSAPSVTVQSR